MRKGHVTFRDDYEQTQEKPGCSTQDSHPDHGKAFGDGSSNCYGMCGMDHPWSAPVFIFSLTRDTFTCTSKELTHTLSLSKSFTSPDMPAATGH